MERRPVGPSRKGLLRIIPLLVVLALVAAACGGDDGDTAAPDGGNGGNGDGCESLRPVELGLSGGSLAFYGYYAAEALGYYEDECLDVNITTTGGSSEAAQQLVTGNFDIAMGVPDAMLAAMQEEPLYPFFTYFTSEFRDWFVPEDSDIQSVDDLDGTTIGITSSQGGEVPLVRFILEDRDIDAEMVEVGEEPASIVTALEQGRIDSYAGGRSHYIAINEGDVDFTVRSILPEEIGEGRPVEGLLTREPHHEDDELLIGVGRATAKGILFCQTSVEACVEAIRTSRPQVVEDPNVAPATIEEYIQFSIPPEEGGELNFSPTTLSGWQDYLEIYSSGPEAPVDDPDSIDLESWVIEDLREEINDFDKDAIREQAENYQA